MNPATTIRLVVFTAINMKMNTAKTGMAIRLTVVVAPPYNEKSR
jgi:hypothetical protein